MELRITQYSLGIGSYGAQMNSGLLRIGSYGAYITRNSESESEVMEFRILLESEVMEFRILLESEVMEFRILLDRLGIEDYRAQDYVLCE